jgi:Ni/Co efflux regulator RcnB
MNRILKHISLLTLVTFIQFTVLSPVSSGAAQDRSRTAPRAAATAPTTTQDEQPEPEEEAVGEVMTLHIGDVAPMDGTLFSVEAAARLLTNLEFTEETCTVRMNEQLRLQEARLRLDIDTEHARFLGLEYRHNEMIRVRDEQITFLTNQIRPRQWYESGEFWFGLGAAVGVIVTVAAGYALGLANN